jgi:hypothetical protein
MNFSIKCSPQEQKLNGIIKILNSALEIVKKFKNRYVIEKKELSELEKKKIYEILFSPLEGSINIFDIEAYNQLMEYLDYKQKKNIGIEIINVLVNNRNNPLLSKLDSIENLQKIIKYIKPLLTDNKNNNEQIDDDISIIEHEQYIVCKLIYIINSTNPEIIYEIYNQLKNIFSYGGSLRRRFTLPALVNAIINFCHKITICYEKQCNKLPENIIENKLNEIINSLDINKISSDDIFHKLMLNIYKLLNEAIGLIAQEKPELAFKFYICSASQVNEILIERDKFSESCSTFIYNALGILEEGKFNQNANVDLFEIISSNLINFKILKNEVIEEIIEKLIKDSQNIQKREDQFRVMLAISQLYYNIIKDGKKVLDCITKARRFADFAMTNPRNLSLFVDLLNKLLYFVDKGEDIVDIKKEQIEDVIELIKGHVRTIKNVPGEDDISYLDEIEKYFNNTLKVIEKRKNDENNQLKEFYQSINV